MTAPEPRKLNVPAHLRDLPNCQRCPTPKPATCELRNTYNALLGYFCRTHGKQALAEQRALDA